MVRDHLGEINFLWLARHIPSYSVNVYVVLEFCIIIALTQSLQGIQLLLIETPVFVTLSLLQKLVCLINVVKINFPLQAPLQSQNKLPIFSSTNLADPDQFVGLVRDLDLSNVGGLVAEYVQLTRHWFVWLCQRPDLHFVADCVNFLAFEIYLAILCAALGDLFFHYNDLFGLIRNLYCSKSIWIVEDCFSGNKMLLYNA